MRKIRIGVTGGIGSGKSFVCRKLENMGYPVFSTDDCARSEMLHNGGLRESLCKLVSPDIFLTDGSLHKPVIRQFLLSSPDNAAAFDAVVHPYVRRSWRHWVESRAENIVFMECALLFEADFADEVDYVLLVTASESLRVRRVMNRDGISEETVRKWIGMQMPEREKKSRADFVIYNEGTVDIDSELLKMISSVSSFDNIG